MAVSDMATITPIRSHVVRISLVDHEHFDYLLLAMALDEAGIQADVSCVDDAEQLLGQLADADIDTLPDLVIIDRRLDGLSALGLLDELRASPVNSQIPVVVFGTAGESDSESCRGHGASWVTAKPDSFAGMVEFASSIGALALHARYRDLETIVVDTYESLRVLIDLSGEYGARALLDLTDPSTRETPPRRTT